MSQSSKTVQWSTSSTSARLLVSFHGYCTIRYPPSVDPGHRISRRSQGDRAGQDNPRKGVYRASRCARIPARAIQQHNEGFYGRIAIPRWCVGSWCLSPNPHCQDGRLPEALTMPHSNASHSSARSLGFRRRWRFPVHHRTPYGDLPWQTHGRATCGAYRNGGGPRQGGSPAAGSSWPS